jgi:serine/threonine-protein kinase HipA
MHPTTGWRLAPAYDVTYAQNPEPGRWTATQQMSVSGKRESISIDDLIACGRRCGIATLPKLRRIIDGVMTALADWESLAGKAKVDPHQASQIKAALSQQRGS